MFKTKSKLPFNLQVIFITTLVTAYVLSTSYDVIRAVIQLATNPNLSGFYTSFLVLGLLPLVLFIVAYVMHVRAGDRTVRIFESMVFAVSASAVYSIISTLTYAFTDITKTTFMSYLHSFGYQLIVSLIVTILAGAYLVSLRRSKKW